ncbi:hypothetical protein LCGC14_1551740 [marine sediment metagenome]|uniref:Uncharacterized protein n=1 Tax=marine sediment metagenome TaxID=412755 RepID=A0A0F9L638_9ZZZZ
MKIGGRQDDQLRALRALYGHYGFVRIKRAATNGCPNGADVDLPAT